MDISALISAPRHIRLSAERGFHCTGVDFSPASVNRACLQVQNAELNIGYIQQDIPRIFTISESEHLIHNPFTEEKYATLGRVLRMKPETRIPDLSSGPGKMLCPRGRYEDVAWRSAFNGNNTTAPGIGRPFDKKDTRCHRR